MVFCTNDRCIHFSFLSVAHSCKFNESAYCEGPSFRICVMIFKFSYYIEIACAFMALLLPSALLSSGDQAVFVTLYYYMRNFCNLIGFSALM